MQSSWAAGGTPPPPPHPPPPQSWMGCMHQTILTDALYGGLGGVAIDVGTLTVLPGRTDAHPARQKEVDRLLFFGLADVQLLNPWPQATLGPKDRTSRRNSQLPSRIQA